MRGSAPLPHFHRSAIPPFLLPHCSNSRYLHLHCQYWRFSRSNCSVRALRCCSRVLSRFRVRHVSAFQPLPLSQSTYFRPHTTQVAFTAVDTPALPQHRALGRHTSAYRYTGKIAAGALTLGVAVRVDVAQRLNFSRNAFDEGSLRFNRIICNSVLLQIRHPFVAGDCLSVCNYLANGAMTKKKNEYSQRVLR